MIAKVLAICVALLFLGGAVQAADIHADSTATIELELQPVAVSAPVEPVPAIVPSRHAVVVATPPPLAPITAIAAPPMDRPPRT